MSKPVATSRSSATAANCGVPAVGSIPHIYAETLSRLIGVKIAVVPYRGGAPIAQDLAAGQLALGSSAPADFSALHKAGQLTIVASSGTARHPSFADVPTFAELGLKGLEANGWNGFFLHGNAPAALAGLYTRVILDAVREPSARAKLVDLGFIPVDLNAEAFITALNADKELWTRLIREADIKLN